MPIVQIHTIEGRPESVKKTAIEKVTEALVEAGCGPRENIRILIQELPSTKLGDCRHVR